MVITHNFRVSLEREAHRVQESADFTKGEKRAFHDEIGRVFREARITSTQDWKTLLQVLDETIEGVGDRWAERVLVWRKGKRMFPLDKEDIRRVLKY